MLKTLTRRVRRHLRRTDTLILECAPLHTEEAKWAAEAPAQVEAACKRGAHVIGFTELGPAHASLVKELIPLVTKHGYTWVHSKGDTPMAVKSSLRVLRAGNVPVEGNNALTYVTFEFHGSVVTVVTNHWATAHADHMAMRAAQTQAVVAKVEAASSGYGLAFFMGDCNPVGHLGDPASQPRADLRKAGLVLAYEELSDFPANVGVNMVGRPIWDSRTKAVSVQTHAGLGSDHLPVTAVYTIARRR